MKCYVGLGSNRGRRLENLQRAGAAIGGLKGVSGLRPSSVYETAALLPEGAPPSWDSPFLNAAVEFEWDGTALDLLAALQAIETEMGREPAPRWAPRVIDLDLLLFGDERITSERLTVPHPRLWERGFVLNPLRDLAAEFVAKARGRPDFAPLWMGIINQSPDSFSGDGKTAAQAAELALEWADGGVGIIDLGAESTRPGAVAVTPANEWERLEKPLAAVAETIRHRLFRPKISIDTRFAATAAKALAAGADIINDVSALGDPAMASVLRDFDCECILMHSLSIPASLGIKLDRDCDPVEEVMIWAKNKLAQAEHEGLKRSRMIIDPGLGFGKSAAQSWALVRGVQRLQSLGVRLAYGHSRKGFLSALPPPERDDASIGVALALARQVEILRVHSPLRHIHAFQTFARS